MFSARISKERYIRKTRIYLIISFGLHILRPHVQPTFIFCAYFPAMPLGTSLHRKLIIFVQLSLIPGNDYKIEIWAKDEYDRSIMPREDFVQLATELSRQL